jgi:hypothetical protein
MIVRLENADGLTGLNQQSLVVLQLFESCDDGVVSLPAPRRAAGSSVYDQVLRTFGDVGVEIIHQHAHGGFLLPAFASEGVAARRANGSRSLNEFRFDGHE